jgi:uncharacterized lipoprotein YddW (UPF0748 family)
MKFSLLTALLLFAAIPDTPGAQETSIILVRGTASVPNAAEKNYALSLARNIDRWLNDLNIAHGVVDDEQLDNPLPAATKLLILSYNPSLSSRQTATLDSFVKDGGKLLVFYGADPKLAGIMNVELGKYLSFEIPGRWSAIRFTSSAPTHLPDTVFQQSRNIRTVLPVRNKSRVIAFWEDNMGTLLEDPALVQSDHGVWMTHVLLNDMDIEGKKRMLAGLIAFYEPSIWNAVAAKRMEQCENIGPWKNFNEFKNGLATLIAGKHNADAIMKELARATELHDRVNAMFTAKQYPETFDGSRRLMDLLIKVYGMAQPARAGELRGVWDHTGTGLYPGKWDKTCAVLAESGFTDIFCNLLWPAQIHYAGATVPKSRIFDIYGDQAEQALASAHKLGLKIHAWKVCWNMEGGSDEMIKGFRKDGRLQVTSAGQTINWLCPSNLENLKYEKSAVRELLKKYPFDGIHLDYIRFRDSTVCFCATCRADFEKATGREIRKWPGDVLEGALKKDFSRWRCVQISRYVRDIAAIARELRPGIKVSAAVYGKYPSCVDAVGQDWAEWLRDGSVDFVCPMNYTPDTAKFSEYVKAQLALPGAKGKIIPGIGVTARESTLNPIQVIDQIQTLRQTGAPGFVLFDLNRILEKEILPTLKLGTTAE